MKGTAVIPPSIAKRAQNWDIILPSKIILKEES